MKDQRKTEIKVGVTVILGLLIFLWIYGWAKNFTVNSHRKEISVEFASVSGLSEGDPVTINGVKKGYVKKIITPFIAPAAPDGAPEHSAFSGEMP